jgi:hypothetical protein
MLSPPVANPLRAVILVHMDPCRQSRFIRAVWEEEKFDGLS